MEIVSNVVGGLIIFSVIITFIAFAFFKKVNVYESFIDGAKEGFEVTVKIIPYLVAMLVGIGIFRASGGMNDSGFWVVSRMSGMTPDEALKNFSVTVGSLAVMGLVEILILSTVLRFA